MEVAIRPQTIPASPVVVRVDVTPSTFAFVSGDTVQLTATASDVSGAGIVGRAVTWISSNTNVATVSGSGLVAWVGVGDAAISARIDGVTSLTPAFAHATVEGVSSVTLDKSTETLVLGQTGVLIATPRAADTSQLFGRVVTWAALDPSVATASADSGTDPHTMTYTTQSVGTARFQATSEGIPSAIFTLTVNAVVAVSVPTTIVLNVTTAAGSPGDSLSLQATIKDQSGGTMAVNGAGQVSTGDTVTWNSNDSALASVSSPTGASTGVNYHANGTPTITCACGGATPATCAITITTSVPTSLSLNISTAPGVAGATATLIATARDASNTIVSSASTTWGVNNGHATATTPGSSSTVFFVDAGTSIVTATLGVLTATCTFTISAATTVLPAGYDPDRLGAEKIAGTAWLNPTLGSDQGRTWVKSFVGVSNGSSGQNPLDSQWGIEVDTTNKFPYVLRDEYIRGGAYSTISLQVDPVSPGVDRWWRRKVFRFVSPNTYGTGSLYNASPSSSGTPPVPHTGFWNTTTQTPNESASLKFLFSWRGTSPRNRFGLIWLASNYLDREMGHNDITSANNTPQTRSGGVDVSYRESGVIYTEMVQTQSLATHPQSINTGNSIGFYAGTLPFKITADRQAVTTTDNYNPAHNVHPGQAYQTSVKVFAAKDAPDPINIAPDFATGSGKYAMNGTMMNNQDWYEMVQNYERLTGTPGVQGGSYMQRVFLRRLTVNGVWDPWPAPCWHGTIATNAVPLLYNGFWDTGNRSGGWPTSTTPGSNGNGICYRGPWEITSAQNPYLWDNYGR